MFDKALAIDPDEVDALALQGVLYVSEMATHARPFDKDLAAKALGQAERAIALAPNSSVGYFAKAQYLTNIAGKPNEAIRVADEGLAINPNSAGLFVSRC